MEILEQHRDLEAGRAMLGHTRIDTTQTYAQIRPAQLKRTVEFYEGKGLDLLSSETRNATPCLTVTQRC
jgi:hypothetical protein